jgi:ribose 5-phosphate isomerase A
VMCSSIETEMAARTLGLSLVRLGSGRPDWGVDGADEVDPAGRLIKGRGGALFREKMLWFSTQRMFLAADPSKFVDALGASFPIPVEVHRDAVEIVARELQGLGARQIALRVAGGKDGPVITEEGHLILDAHFSPVADGLHAQIKVIPGVIETGLFEGYRFERL